MYKLIVIARNFLGIYRQFDFLNNTYIKTSFNNLQSFSTTKNLH